MGTFNLARCPYNALIYSIGIMHYYAPYVSTRFLISFNISKHPTKFPQPGYKQQEQLASQLVHFIQVLDQNRSLFATPAAIAVFEGSSVSSGCKPWPCSPSHRKRRRPHHHRRLDISPLIWCSSSISTHRPPPRLCLAVVVVLAAAAAAVDDSCVVFFLLYQS